MLQFMRGGLTSIFATVLLGLLVASFALWGVGDPFSAISGNDVAVVGERHVTLSEYEREFQNKFNDSQQRLGDSFTRDMAVRFGVGEEAKNELIARVALSQAAKNLGIRVTDAQLRQYITEIPAMQNDLGQFDRFRFEQMAQYRRYRPEDFEDLLRSEMVRFSLVQAIVNGVQVPKTLEQTFSKFLKEERTAEILTLPTSKITDITPPDDAALNSYYEDNTADYMAPEYRSLSYIVIRPEDYSKIMEVLEEDIREQYEQRIADYTTEGQRSIQQIILEDAEKAKAAFADLEVGKKFSDVIISHTDSSATDADIGAISRQDALDTYGADATALIFEAASGNYTSPVETPFGWYIFKVGKITDASVRAYEDVKAELEGELRDQLAKDKTYDISNQIEDELAGGATMEEIVDSLLLTRGTVQDVDANGLGPDGKRRADMPLISGLMAQAFELAPGDEPELEENAFGGFYLLRVDNITDSVLRPHEDVRTAVLENWMARARQEKAQEISTSIKDSFEEGKSLKDFLSLAPHASFNEVTIGRLDNSGTVSREIQAGIFKEAVSSLTVQNASDGDGIVLLYVKERRFSETPLKEAAQKRLAGQLEQALKNDMLNSYQQYLYESLPVKINERNVQAVLDQISQKEQ